MYEVTLDELKMMASEAREGIWEAAREQGRTPRIYLHWTAGRYNQTFEDYHVNILGDGTIMVPSGNLDVYRAHTYKRNSGAIGVCLCCAYGATTNTLGDYPPTERQIETMAQVIVALADGLWLTICKQYVSTHGEAADNEDGIYPHEEYGPRSTCERWDLEYLGTPESPRFRPWAEDGSRGGDVGAAACCRKIGAIPYPCQLGSIPCG